ncbi:UbiA family prenyltransferase [Streptomyces sp. NBC_00250]|uniref:SCO3242 family prenyltransferase n=1 Tax=Streptomyces sp. NBC_00250 TaxID=2903641 RepID=UPI002E29060D|nr:UbiA family prenyltransferase [Streptomyces sp. NBC_00250]
MTGLRALLELVRAPAALTVPGDTLAGATAAGRPLGAETAGLAAASVCLYWAGMALNDWADREVDAEERPGRPLPSGRISPGTALGAAAALTGAGLALAAAAGGRRHLGIAVPLAATVWAYDLAVKETPFGPAAMAAARGLDVLMGAGPDQWRSALPAALTIGCHTYTLTLVSRREVEGATAGLPAAALGASTALALVTSAFPASGTEPVHRAASTVLLAAYLAAGGPAQLAATARPDPPRLRRAVASGIHALIPLQAALTARAGNVGAALPLMAAFPLARRLSRKVSPT